jgi:serine/threonine protein phosphatase PrpC
VAVYDRARNAFYVANTGDTRAVLCRGGAALDLSYDRKGSDSEEIARVIRAGGYVANGRIQVGVGVEELHKIRLFIIMAPPQIWSF